MSFDFVRAEMLARVCQFIYDYKPEFNLGFGTPKEVVRLQDKKTKPTSFAAVLLYSDKTIVAYRGTVATVEDWMQDFDVDLVKSPLGGRVHKGFLSELNLIQPQIDEVLKKKHKSPLPLYLTGHSQGGAVAVLATRHIEISALPVTHTYTFAAPRPGDTTFVSGLTSPISRVEYGCDLVPHVPPGIPGLNMKAILSNPLVKILLSSTQLPAAVEKLITLAKTGGGYTSAGTLNYAAQGKQLMTDMTLEQERDIFIERLIKLLRAGGTAVSDHGIANYISIVDKF